MDITYHRQGATSFIKYNNVSFNAILTQDMKQSHINKTTFKHKEYKIVEFYNENSCKTNYELFYKNKKLSETEFNNILQG